MKKKSYAVFGLGRYGMAVAKELVENGMDVLAVDASEKIVNDAAGILPVCKCADITDIEVFSRLGISNMDVVVVAMASNLEASIIAVTLCKEAGIQRVIAKCSSEMQQRILKRSGADQVVFPEQESGVHLAKTLLQTGLVDMLALSKDVSIVEMSVKSEWVGKTLIQLDLRRKHGINVIAVKEKESVDVNVNPELPLTQEMTLIVLADMKRIRNVKRSR